MNSARISGSNVGVTQRALGAKALAAKRIVAMQNLPMTSFIGELNPYYGKTHSPSVRESISASKGTRVLVYELLADGTSVLLGTYNSATKASQGLALINILISRPTILSYLNRDRAFNYGGRVVYFTSK